MSHYWQAAASQMEPNSRVTVSVEWRKKIDVAAKQPVFLPGPLRLHIPSNPVPNSKSS